MSNSALEAQLPEGQAGGLRAVTTQGLREGLHGTAAEPSPEQTALSQCTGVMAKRQCFLFQVFFELEFQIVYLYRRVISKVIPSNPLL